MIKFNCPYCRESVSFADSLYGKVVSCTWCRRVFQVRYDFSGAIPSGTGRIYHVTGIIAVFLSFYMLFLNWSLALMGIFVGIIIIALALIIDYLSISCHISSFMLKFLENTQPEILKTCDNCRQTVPLTQIHHIDSGQFLCNKCLSQLNSEAKKT